MNPLSGLYPGLIESAVHPRSTRQKLDALDFILLAELGERLNHWPDEFAQRTPYIVDLNNK